MRKILLIFTLSFITLSAYAQTKVAYCDVYARGGGKNMKINIIYDDAAYKIKIRSNLGYVLNLLAADGWVLDNDVVIPRHPLYSSVTRHKLHLIMKKEYKEGDNPFLRLEEKADEGTLFSIKAYGKEILVSKSISVGTWNDAIEYCKFLGEGWKLPTAEQIRYICDSNDIRFYNCWTNEEANDMNDAIVYIRRKNDYKGYSKSYKIGIIAVKVVNKEYAE